MLRTFYIYLGKKLHYALLPFLRFGKEKRVRIAVLSDDRHILLVRNWFGYQNWSLPGGGIKKGETPESAIIRELYEETGLVVNHASYLRSYGCHESAVPFEVDVYFIAIPRPASLLKGRSFEIIEKKWHPVGKLPKNLAMSIQEILK